MKIVIFDGCSGLIENIYATKREYYSRILIKNRVR